MYYEEFVPLASFNNQIGISKNAVVINFKTNHILSKYIGTDMYEHVVIYVGGKRYRKRVHRLMAEAFLNNCAIVDHIDANKSNNILSNLRAVTQSENIKKAYKENTYVNPHKGRGIWVVAEENHIKHYFDSMRKCEEYTGVDRHRIRYFIRGERTNLTPYKFYYNEEDVSTMADECMPVELEISTSCVLGNEAHENRSERLSA